MHVVIYFQKRHLMLCIPHYLIKIVLSGQVTTLNMDNQHITKLSGLERLDNLRYVSFNNNDITKLEVRHVIYSYCHRSSLISPNPICVESGWIVERLH